MSWDRIGEIVLSCLTQGWSFVAVALAVYYAGQSAKRLADRKGWRAEHANEASWFDATLPVQPVLVGALLMQIPWPVWTAIDGLDKDPSGGVWTEVAARMAYGMLAGALAGQVFEIIQTAIRFGKKRAGISEDGRQTPVSSVPKMVPSDTVSVIEPTNESTRTDEP